MQNLTALPQTLADICNSMVLNGSVCQGFTYDVNTKLAVFKGQPPELAVNIAQAASQNDNVSLWWLNAGKLTDMCSYCTAAEQRTKLGSTCQCWLL